jgi:hypothetical protein
MRPLDPLASISVVAKLLKGAPAAEVRAEIARLESASIESAAIAARAFAEGALALREGALGPAYEKLTLAADGFRDLGENEASVLARCEAWLAAIRRGPRSIYDEAIAALGAIAEHPPSAVARVVALHYRGTAERFAGDALATQRTLLTAFAESEPFLPERAQILNSLGTLYVIMGAFGAAHPLLEHAAELHHRNGDAVGEAIAFGQLGSAALARGELDRARTFLQKQEWFSSRVGDAFGRARALVFLADLAILAKRPDDAVLLATNARAIAESVSPPLTMWIAYATRSIGRAKLDLEDASAKDDLERARAAFGRIGNQLGDALARWDLAHLGARDRAHLPAAREGWFGAAWALGTLGLSARVAELLTDAREALADDEAGHAAIEEAIAVAAQGAPHLAFAQELELVYGESELLARIATRRTAAQRNLARLAALTIAGQGLYVAAIAARALGAESASSRASNASLPGLRASAAAIAELPELTVWIWALRTPIEEVARDLAAARAALGEDARAVLAIEPEGRVLSPPFVGEVAARVASVSVAPLISRALALASGDLAVDAKIAWTGDAEGLAKLAGYAIAR